MNIIKGKLSKDSFDDNDETKEKCLLLKSIGEEVLHPRAYTGNHEGTVKLNELNDKQVKFLKDNKVFDFFRRSKGAEGVTLPENKHDIINGGDYALKNALFLGKHKTNDVWLSDDGNLKEIVSDTEFKMNEGNIEEILGVYNGETPGDTIQGVASVASKGGRKSRKTRRKKRKPKKSKKSRKSRK